MSDVVCDVNDVEEWRFSDIVPHKENLGRRSLYSGKDISWE